jgi:glutamate synthase (NADPH/NADH) small chain
MGKPTGFIEFTREAPEKTAPAERIQNFKEFVSSYTENCLNQQ